MVKKRPDFRSLGQSFRELQVHELLRLERVGAFATAAGRRLAFGQRLQGDDGADLTAIGDVLSVQGLSFAVSKQAMRRARLGVQGFGCCAAHGRLAEYDLPHRVDTPLEVAFTCLFCSLSPTQHLLRKKLCRSHTRKTARPTPWNVCSPMETPR